ncbi:MAG TPA: TlpA disulfide reductase family protein [Micromonosporaceae bacterium]|nr:TlpA disulfide reductase family protein [Micromonosporaceae bacterium]
MPAVGAESLPDLVLACMSGGEAKLSQVTGPAVINLWASWCPPCRTELPAFQEYHSRVGERVSVVGVVTKEKGRIGPESLVDDLGLRFPMLWDPDGTLLQGVGRTGLPITLFIRPDGRIAHLYNGVELDAAGIEALAERHLGVRPAT